MGALADPPDRPRRNITLGVSSTYVGKGVLRSPFFRRVAKGWAREDAFVFTTHDIYTRVKWEDYCLWRGGITSSLWGTPKLTILRRSMVTFRHRKKFRVHAAA